MANDVQVVILAAGKGTRMGTSRPKVLQPLCGRPLVAWVADVARAVEPRGIVLVVGPGADEVETAARSAAGELPLRAVVQEPALGTGHALQVAMPALEDAGGPVVVLYGDMPLLRGESLAALVEAREAAGAGAIALLTARIDRPAGYGRILRGAGGGFAGIVEERDASGEQRALGEVNLGVYAFSGGELPGDLARIGRDNAQAELYLTDVPALARAAGRRVETLELADASEALGVNTFAQLAAARAVLQARILEHHMERGVLIEDPATTWIAHGVEIGAGTHIRPCTYVHAGVRIGAGCEVGPFTQLRKGTVLEDGAEVGNFTECKNSTLGRGAKAKHLSYLGDADIGAGSNIGAGTIFANYDGREKHRTSVGEDAFLGSGTIVVAPNAIPAGAITGAGAVLTRGARVGPGETWVGVPARKHAAVPDPPPDPS